MKHRVVTGLTLMAALTGSVMASVKNVALDRQASASGSENSTFVAAKAFDGLINRQSTGGAQSRWASDVKTNFNGQMWQADQANGPIWLQIDLGEVRHNLQELIIDWEVAKATDYRIEVSNDGSQWIEAWKSNGPSTLLTEHIKLPKPLSARFVRLAVYGFKKGNWGAVSVYEMQIFDGPAPATLKSLVADFDVKKHLRRRGRYLGYKLPQGFSAKIVASTYEQVLDLEGNIYYPLSDKITEVTFEISDGKESALTAPQEILFEGTAKTAGLNAKPKVIPALQEWAGAKGHFAIQPDTRLFVEAADARTGQPTLGERLAVFAQDFAAITGQNLNLIVGDTDEAEAGDIVVHLDLDKAHLGSEAYELNVADEMTIRANDPIGAFWATRSILQVLKAENNRFPKGLARDYPRYPVRGFMYDVGRKPATLEAIYAVMQTMSWYKMNDLQLHLNDNFIWLHDYTQIPNKADATAEQKKAAIAEVMAAAPTAFRLESDMVGENGVALTATDRFYTKEAFGDLIDAGRAYGVNVVPEIDVPGHAMSFVRVRPDLMYRGGLSKPHDVERVAMLDASEDVFDPTTGKTYREETLDFIKDVFDEYLDPVNGEKPVFRDGVVHIGTDEYYGNAEDYRAFADDMLRYIKSKGFTPRLWGSLTAKKGQTPVISDGVQMHIWSTYWQQPQPAIDLGFDIINILDFDTYMVPNGTGNVGGYGDLVSLTHLYGKNWQPHIMRGHKIIPGHPKMLGAQFAVWNDNSFRRDTGLTDYDLYDRIQNTGAVIAEKTWNDGLDQPYREFAKLFKTVGVPPNANPKHQIPSQTDLVLSYEFENRLMSDNSGNGYNAVGASNISLTNGHFGRALKLNGGTSFLKLPVQNLAPDYKAEFWVRRDSAAKEDQVLFSSFAGQFKAVQGATGKVGLTRDTWDYSFNYTLPVGQWVKLTLVANGRNLTLFADDQEIGAPTRHKYPQSHKYDTFIFPLEYVGAEANAFNGAIDSFRLTKQAGPDMTTVLPTTGFKISVNSEQGSGADGNISAVLDGNKNSYWHSRYSPAKDEPPFPIVVEMGKKHLIDRVSFLPRQDNENGNPLSYTLFVADKDGQWVQVATGRGTGRTLRTLSFEPQLTDQVKLVLEEGVGNFGTMAELYIHQATKGQGQITALGRAFNEAASLELREYSNGARFQTLLKEWRDRAADLNLPESEQQKGIDIIHQAILLLKPAF